MRPLSIPLLALALAPLLAPAPAAAQVPSLRPEALAATPLGAVPAQATIPPAIPPRNFAQAPLRPLQDRTAAEPAATPAPAAPVPLRLEAGTGRLLTLPGAATTVIAADPRVARVQPSSPTSVFIMAVDNGRTTVVATNDVGRPVAEYDVTVYGGRVQGERGPGGERAAAPAARPLNPRQIESQIRSLMSGPGRVQVRAAGRALVLSGTVSTAAEARRIEAIARGMANADTEIVNEIGVLSAIQVNIRVRVAEISRDLTRQFGFNWAALGNPGNWAYGIASGAAAGPLNAVIGGAIGSGVAGASPQRLGLRFNDGTNDINGIIDALAADNLVSILAEPNLTAQSGEVASFLAGGEFPIPVAGSGADGNNSVTIEFKTFGVSLAFVPIVLGNDRLTLRVRPEVSELSEQGAISLPLAGGTIRIPALSVRRAETTIELGSGQSFAIAGLLQRNTAQLTEGVNGLTDIPVLGALFRSDRFQRRETELVIIVTPYLVQPVSNPTALAAPTDNFRPATSLERILMQRQVSAVPPGAPIPPGLGFRFE
ncbi:pilus assembly protein [Falsiroseomonas bella]|uniref:Pilus assembly protein n=1 Tax=Falsiroseomonas bella TaxID=2184016 RepID=A0A317F8B8_9PROT|nr:type II and III secretion system protein family protein [Falsiroseomonas bella]PWS34199.1 pilus assembly protein [Falsiroseomonas bella]